MKNIFFTTLSLFIILFFTSCQKDLKVTIPYDGDKQVINALFYADSNVYCQISKSERITRNPLRTNITNATVQLFEGNTLIETMTLKTIGGKQLYASNYKVKVGFKYTIKSTVTGLPNAEGTDSVPTAANAIITSRTRNNSTNPNSYTHNLKIKLIDPSNEENFYLVQLYDADTVLAPTGARYRLREYSSYNFLPNITQTTSTPSPFPDDRVTNTLFISDETFNGRELALSLDYDEQGISEGNRIVAVVTKLSKSTYRYLTSLDIQQNNQGNPFAEASIVYNNIKNGFGIVGAANQIFIGRRKN